MNLQSFSRLFRVSFGTIPVVKKTQFEGCFSFGTLVLGSDSDIHNLIQMVLCDWSLAVGTVDISKHFVRFTLLVTVAIINTKFKELLQIFNSVIVIIRRHLFLNQSNLLIAFSFLVLVVSTLGNIEALFEEGQSQVIFSLFTIFNGNELIDAHQITRDVPCNRIEHAFHSFLKGSFKVAHGFTLVQNSFFANAEAFESIGLSLNKLELGGDLKATLMEVTGGFVILKLLINISYGKVGLKSFFSITLAPILLAVNEWVRQKSKHFRGLFKAFLGTFLHLVFFKQGRRRFNCGGGSFVSQIEEINVCFNIPTKQELNAELFRRNFVGQSEFTLILKVVWLSSGLSGACGASLGLLLVSFLG